MIVGLGNPGPRYRDTRHNIGFRTVDFLAAGRRINLRRPFFRPYEIGADSQRKGELALVKPLQFMNNSGLSLPGILKKLNSSPERLLVVCDTLDLEPGVCRLKRRGKDAGHNGLKSIIACLGTDEFMRLYIGIGRPAFPVDVVDWVLGIPDDQEKRTLHLSVERAARAIELLLDHSIEYVMNELNRKADKAN